MENGKTYETTEDTERRELKITINGSFLCLLGVYILTF